MASRHGTRARRGYFILFAALASLAMAVTPAAAKPPPGPGFLTGEDPMLIGTAPGSSVLPIMTVGDTLDGYRFEALPDGISFLPNKYGTVDLYINHETSTVPFPVAANGADWRPTNNTTALGTQNDFDNSQLSLLTLNQATKGVLAGSYAIASDENFQRFCSNFLGTKEAGFKKPILFTNEEAVDWVNREGDAFAFPGESDARQAGAVVAHNTKGKTRVIWGMGRLNHENSLAVAGYGHPVLLTGDDTFTTTPSQSQLYSYIAKKGNDVWKDKGELWAFVSDTPTRQKYEDFTPGDATSAVGHFIQVPKLIATGRNPDGSELMAADVPADLGGPYPPPPNDSTWQRFNNVGIDGPQWVLEKWSQLHGVFNFIRLEDMAYDKRPGMSNVVYIVDSGRGTAGVSQAERSTNGRVWEMTLDPTDPTNVLSLRILIEGDDQPVKTVTEIHQPDNIESTPVGLYITEDPGSAQQFPFGSINPISGNFDPAATNARIWQYQLVGGAMSVAAVVDQSADEGPTDVDDQPANNHGSWESSGIIDVSSVFGPGTFLVTVQAHSLWIAKQSGPDNLTRSLGLWSMGADGWPDWMYKREGGQLVLLTIPGG